MTNKLDTNTREFYGIKHALIQSVDYDRIKKILSDNAKKYAIK